MMTLLNFNTCEFEDVDKHAFAIRNRKSKNIVHHIDISGFEPRLGQTKEYGIGIRFFSAKDATLRSKNKDCLARNQDSVSEWDDISI